MLSTNKQNTHARGSERRQATVMFADISGFTALSEKSDPEEITAIMNDCFERLSRVIINHGGAIDKFIGDCVMATFGVPHAIENAPVRAVQAALDIRQALYEFNRLKKTARPLDVHIGINSGEVLAGEVGAGDKKAFTVMGDTVNLAARLEDASEAGQIMVGPLTFRYSRHNFRFNALRPVSVKGKSGLIQAYEALGPIQGDSAGVGLEEMAASELVGRAEERRQFEEKIKQLQNGNGGIISLIGEAGVGKSRLCAEIFAATVMSGVTLLEGRALSTGRNLSYYPIIDAFKKWFGIGEEDDEAAALAKLETGVRGITSKQSADRTGDIVPFVATLMGYPLSGAYVERMKNVSGDALAKLIAKQMRDLLGVAGQCQPVCFVLEDLHWADSSTLALMQSVVTVANDLPVLFLFNFRPDYTDTCMAFHRDITEKFPGRCTDIVLNTLSPEHSYQLTKNLLKVDGLPKKITDQVIQRSGGNPFFIEEVVRSFIELGYFRTTGHGYVADTRLESASIPNSIDEVIMTRVDHLAPKMRNLLRIASVIGRRFFYRVLADIIGNAQDLEEGLAGLSQMEFIRERVRMDEVEYLFKHALAQEVVYNSLLLKERKEIHLRVATAIEKLFENRLHDFYGVLAMHFMQGEDLEKAEVYLEKAGAAALNASASSEAVTYFQQAVSIYRDKQGQAASPLRLAELEKNVATACRRKGDYAATTEHCRKALAYLGYSLTGPRKYLAAISGVLSICRWAYLPDVRKNKAPDATGRLRLELMYILTWALMLSDYKQSLLAGLSFCRLELSYGRVYLREWFEPINDLVKIPLSLGILESMTMRMHARAVRQVYDRHTRNLLHESELWLFFILGRTRPEYDPAVSAYYTAIGDFPRLNYYACFWAIIFINQGRFDKARDISWELKTVSEDYQNPVSLMLHYEIETLLYFARGDYDSADENAAKLVALGEQLEQTEVEKLYLAHQVRVLIDRNELKRAKPIINAIRESLNEKNTVFSPIHAAPCYIALIAYYIHRLKADDVGKKERIRLLRESKPFLKPMLKYSRRFIQRYPEALRYAGLWYRENGQSGRAMRKWQKGLQESAALDMKPESARIHREMGIALLTRKNSDRPDSESESLQHLKTARDIFVGTSLQENVQKIDRLMASN